jgi:hypothetical protein
MQPNCDTLYRNPVALAEQPLCLMPPSHHLHSPNTQPTPGQNHNHAADHTHTHAANYNPAQGQVSGSARGLTSSVLGWPGWQRVLAVLPVLLLLWLAVAWASAEVQPW